jgi:two-component system sensor histidine kinase VicK
MPTERIHHNRRSGVMPEYANPGIYTGCWKLALDTHKLTICPRSRKMLGLPKADGILLADMLALIPPQQLKELIKEFRYACTFDTRFESQVKITTFSGKVKWLRISGVQYYRRWGSADQMVGVIEDISQRVNEECLSLAVVNHELRSPLTIIKLNVQLLINILSGGLDKYPVKVLNNVDLHINCMTNLIEEYLTSSVDEHRRSEMNLTVFDLDELIDIMISEMKTLHPGYRFSKQSEPKIMVKADKYKIVQVLINYLTNAVNFSPKSSQITIGTMTTASCVEIAVKDQGIGIPAGHERQLFQKFYQADQCAARQKNSKGLGLYLVKKIIKEHDGMVRAEKGRDGGSVFYFSLPVHKDESYVRAARAQKKMYQ